MSLTFFGINKSKGRTVVNNPINSKPMNNTVKGVITPPGMFSQSNSHPTMQQVTNNSSQYLQRPTVQSRANVFIPQANHVFENESDLMAANTYPLPPSATIQVASAAGGASIRVYVLNQASLNSVTNNGGGAGTVTYTYQDGFAGVVLSNILTNARGGVGAIAYGAVIRAIVTSSKAGDPVGLAAASPRFDINNAYGSTIPTNFNITTDQTRSDYDTSIEVMSCVQNITNTTQFSFIIPILDTFSVTLYFTPNFKR